MISQNAAAEPDALRAPDAPRLPIVHTRFAHDHSTRIVVRLLIADRRQRADQPGEGLLILRDTGLVDSHVPGSSS
jgi:hypothetical protein